jgi:pimeloyl-ACP methyl ester carboxylesterase
VSVRVSLAGVFALVCAALSVAVPSSADAQSGPLAFGACAANQVAVPAAGLQCATLQVPFDRSDPTVGTVALAVQRVPASAPRTGTIVLLAGGPGQPALPSFERLLAPLAEDPALRGFELVAFDQRGTGQSEELQCPEPNQRLTREPGSFIGECGLALGPTRAFYTSQESVEDLDTLRQALGGTPLSLLAVSYGGRVAGTYAREHPQGVARMVLDSPSPLTGTSPFPFARLRALRRVLDEGICGAGACRSFSSDVYADLTRLVSRLHHRAMRTRIYAARGRLRRASVTEAGVLRLLSGLDLAKGARELAPAAIAAAAHGDAVPLARLTYGLTGESHASLLADAAPATSPAPGFLGEEWVTTQAPLSDSSISVALFVTTYCDESELPWSPDSPPAGRAAALHGWLVAQPAQAFTPFSSSTILAESSLQLCKDWPATPPAPPAPTGVSAVPTLLLSGDDDLRTPYEQTLTVASGYSDGQIIRVPDTGHSTVTTDLTGCAKTVMIEFLTAGQAPTSCPGSSEPQALPLPPASLGRLPAAASSSHVAGQVATAAAMTIEDLFGQTSFVGGGLRGGYWIPEPTGLVLHGMTDVPGVALSGTVLLDETATGLPAISGHLTVRGHMTGTLTLHGRTLNGHVGGVSVHAHLAAL